MMDFRANERGAVATIVAVLFGGGVVLGMLALSVDVGNMMFERRQLQNGADAVAQKMADICAKDPAKCDPANADTLGKLNTLNAANAADEAAGLDAGHPSTTNGVCGHAPGSANLPACSNASVNAAINNLKECPPLPSWVNQNVPYVTAYTITKTKAGSSVLKAWFNGSSTSVRACARVAWGPSSSAFVMPLTFSECEWNVTKTIGFGTETSLPLKYAKNVQSKCDNYKGRDYDGGFGWLAHGNSVCGSTIDANSWVEADTGVGAGNDCIPKVVPGQTIYIPIYDCINKTKSFCGNDAMNPTTYYHIAGLAAFEVTAVDITGNVVGTPGNAAHTECIKESLDNKCIYGKFVKDLVPVGSIDTSGTATNYGIVNIQSVG
ncbi:MAG: pilus assembly protein TadG-related protein [Ornithinibacter sp.]